jgi:hypothetical protein
MSKKSRKSELLDGFCHSERSRGISSYLTLQMIGDVSTTLDMTRTADGKPGREAELALETTKGEGRPNSALHNHPRIPSPAAAGSRNPAMLGLGFATGSIGSEPDGRHRSEMTNESSTGK